MVKPEMEDDGTQVTSIIHVDSIMWGAHLIGVYGKLFLPCDFIHFDSLTAFQAYYVNKFIDYHANKIAFWNALLTIFGVLCDLLHALDFNRSLIVNSGQTVRGILRLIQGTRQ